MTQRVTLKPGDYVRTEVMDEATYHAVARAFTEAGCKGVPGQLCKDANVVGWSSLFKRYGWDWQAGSSFHRELTPEQVINATSAGRAATNLVTAVRTAKITLDDARAEYTKALDALREALGEGLVVSEAGDAPDDDMTDPANWRAGDVVKADGVPRCQDGKVYELKIDPDDGELSIVDDDGDWCSLHGSLHGRLTGRLGFRFHHRPNT